METMTIADFEEAVWKLERVRIVIRAGSQLRLHAYDFQARAPEVYNGTAKTIGEFIIRRLYGYRYVPNETEIVVIDGRGKRVPGNMLLSTVRASYHT